MRNLTSVVLAACALSAIVGATAWAEEPAPEKSLVRFGAFVDTYVAWDFNQPTDFTRAYTTQPVRHDEFNLNLAFVEGKLESERVRGRLAVQLGTSTVANYANEPSIGRYSGPSNNQFIQEAYAGFRIVPDLWLDAGIFFSHIGLESFISRDNWTYTRSLIADNSPYYQSGARLIYQPNAIFAAHLHFLNGWQTISENNTQKSLGMQLALTPVRGFTVTYNNLIGNEASPRFFNDFSLKMDLSSLLSLSLTADLGFQQQGSQSSYSAWYGGAFIGQLRFTERFRLAGRVEGYSDPDQVVISGVPAAGGFRAWGGSVNADFQVDPRLLWRSEVRGLAAQDPVFPGINGLQRNDVVVTSSLSLTI